MAQSVGAANLAAGLQDAYLGLSPVIAITGRRPPLYRYRHSYQEIEHDPLFEAVTKFNGTADTVEQLPLLLRQAFREATSGAPGPVHLDFQGFTGEVVVDAEADLEVIVQEQFSHYPPFRPEPEPRLVREAAKVLRQSKRPIIVAGGGVTTSQAGAEVVALAEMLSIPVATSLNGKGTIPDNHRLAVGVVGSYSCRCANQAVSEADLVLFIGSHTGSQVTNEWRIPRTGTPIIQIDINPEELGRNYPTKVALQGDVKATVRQLVEIVEPVSQRVDWLQRVDSLVDNWRREMEPMCNFDGQPIRPERLCKEIAEFLPSNALLVSDTGHSAIWTSTLIALNQPGQSYVRCAGSLGWAFPAALGVKCATPERPVICFTGDGGFWYHMAELETALRWGINTVTVINNNRSLNQVREGTERAYSGQSGNPHEVWRFSDTDFAKLAQDIGCFGVRVKQPGELRKVLNDAVSCDKPVVIDVVTDVEATPPSAWS